MQQAEVELVGRATVSWHRSVTISCGGLPSTCLLHAPQRRVGAQRRQVVHRGAVHHQRQRAWRAGAHHLARLHSAPRRGHDGLPALQLPEGWARGNPQLLGLSDHATDLAACVHAEPKHRISHRSKHISNSFLHMPVLTSIHASSARRCLGPRCFHAAPTICEI